MRWTLLLITCIQLTYCKIILRSANELDWWENSIIYEIFPLSFKDSNGDGSGDFEGITQKLDYLADIGVTAIWLTPCYESPLASGGYDITNYQDVNPVFGTIEDFKNLLKTAHSKNIKIIMDFVPNHTSNQHIWFKKSVNRDPRYVDYYIWKDAKNQEEVLKNSSVIPIPPNNWLMISYEEHSAWFWHDTRKQFYYAIFGDNLPDLNYRNQKVHDEMKNILNFWLDVGIDGIRIDALKHVYESESMTDEPRINENDDSPYHNYFDYIHLYTEDQKEIYDLIREWRLLLDEYKKKDHHRRIMMTESYSSHEVLFQYYLSGVEVPTNFDLLKSNRISPKDFERSIEEWITGMPIGAKFNSVLQNHDQPRFPSVYGSELIDGMNALPLFLPGVSILLYGGEIGMDCIPDIINRARSPMQWDDTQYAGFTDGSHEPWIGVHPNYVTRNVKLETNDPKSYLNFFKSVSKLRQAETFERGGLATEVFNDTVFVLNRFLPGHNNYTLIINMDTNNIQSVRLSNKISNLRDSLTVYIGSGNSNFDTGKSISTTDWFDLRPGATIILTEKTEETEETEETETKSIQSSSTKLYITLKLLLLSLFFIKICIL